MAAPRHSQTTRQAPRPSGIPQGTPGGVAGQRLHGLAGGALGPTVYLWIMVAVEALLMGWLRHANRRHHGG